MVKMVPEGRPFTGIALAALVVLALLAWRSGGAWRVAVLVWVPVALWVPAFFRNPSRQGPRDARLVLAPADGRIVSVAPVEEPDYLRGRATRVSVFMNVFNVHVNYHPMDGVVEYRHYRPGRFVNASLDKASQGNEQASLGVRSGGHRVLVRQIAGLIAHPSQQPHSCLPLLDVDRHWVSAAVRPAVQHGRRHGGIRRAGQWGPG